MIRAVTSFKPNNTSLNFKGITKETEDEVLERIHILFVTTDDGTVSRPPAEQLRRSKIADAARAKAIREGRPGNAVKEALAALLALGK